MFKEVQTCVAEVKSYLVVRLNVTVISYDPIASLIKCRSNGV